MGLVLLGFQSFGQNIQLAANLSYGNSALANIGGYVDSLGNEYALVGTDFGLSIVDVTDPANPVIRFTVNGPSSDWREVKTYRKYAYVTTEGGGGLQIIDLSNLPATINSHNWTGDAAISGQLSSIHALHCDTAKGFLYLYGSNIGSGQSLFIDLADPWNPHYAGSYTFPGSGNDRYVHDGFVVNDTMYESHIYSGFCAIVEVSDKANPVLLATISTPTNFTHNTWLSDDHKTLFTTDENSASYLGIFDIHDLANITEIGRWQTAPGSGSIIHNTHILNDYAITSWYTQGVVITDVARPHNPIEVGHYDTYPASDGNGFFGCWGVYPFLPSGNLVASDINNGLFVLTPTYVRACYLEGIVTDSVTGAFLNGAVVEILTTGITKSSDLSGQYATGTATAGTYDIRISKSGYYTRTMTGVSLVNGVLTTLDVKLVPFQTFAFSGHVNDSISAAGIANASIVLSSTNGLTYTATTNASGDIIFPAVVPDTYTLYAGKWGYRTTCGTVTLVPGDSVNTLLAQGYYDDFTFDFGWTVSGTSGNAWERGEPTGTFDGNSTEINPEYDASGDCGDQCFVTDNGGSPYNNHDVDNGNTILTSPVFDATIYQTATLSYYRRYLDINGTGQPNDTMKVYLTDGVSTVLVESVGPNASGNGTWVHKTFTLGSLMTAGTNMQIRVEVADNTPGNIVEGSFDQFEITGQLVNGIGTMAKNDHITAFPNPFSKSIAISYELGNYNSTAHLIIRDITGRIVEETDHLSQQGSITLGEELNPGIYLTELWNGNNRTLCKIVKQ
ncbi:MAG: choice-of-anchor B family protein [Bacteroidetes bacterium]|nr:choice-of-anchor B family protein [Bacteroidota bacterium]